MANAKDVPHRKTTVFPPAAYNKMEESDLAEDKERVTQVMDRLLGELNTSAELVDDFRSKLFGEGEAKNDSMSKEPGIINLESQARRAASKIESINRSLKSILCRL
jgi:hypothetical protein